MGFIIIKLSETYELPHIFTGMALLSLFLLLKTLILHPFGDVPETANGVSAFRYSVVGKMFCTNTIIKNEVLYFIIERFL